MGSKSKMRLAVKQGGAETKLVSVLERRNGDLLVLLVYRVPTASLPRYSVVQCRRAKKYHLNWKEKDEVYYLCYADIGGYILFYFLLACEENFDASRLISRMKVNSMVFAKF